MSGIAGILRFDGKPVDQAILDKMLKAMKPRGPHGQVINIEESVGLGLTFLSHSPQSNEQVDFTFPSLHLPITFDGRLDNRDELAAKLNLVIFGVSDAELIFLAYKKWGDECIKYLLGDFAFALWDSDTKTLFCGRDHFGTKPFYYHYSAQYFTFGSSPYSLLAAHKELREINEARITDFLVGFEGIDETSTFYKRIFRLPRRYCAKISCQEMQINEYWDLKPTSSIYYKEQDYLEAFHEIFSKAVECRLGSPSNTFVPLSGGMDSTSIAAVARNIYAQKNASLLTISAVSVNEDNSEAGRIQSVLAQGGIRGRVISEQYLNTHIEELISDLENIDEPFDVLENSWRPLYRHAQKDGIHISLDGIDSDLIFSGSNYLTMLWKNREYQAFLGETLFSDGLTKAYYKHPLFLFLSSLRSVIPPDWLKELRREYMNQTVASRLKENSLINQDLARSTHIIERQKLYSSYETRASNTPLIESHKKSIFHPHLQAALERYDRIAAAFSIESRHPFLDVRLVEFCLNLPWQLKTYRGWNKVLLRKDMESLLPNTVVQSKEKKHPAWRYSIQILNTKKGYFREILNEEMESLKTFVDINSLNKAWDQILANNDFKSVPEIWYAIGLAFWLRRQKQDPF